MRVTELSNGFRLLVGRDLEERRRLFGIVANAAQWSLLVVIVLGIGGGIFVARRVLHRIDAMTGTTQRIMAGDLSGRLPVGRSGDELDRLAENLNAMLERIEALMTGLKEVSDNIAHDLKTPLTRLRNRAEEALASSGSEAEYRAALERTIEESDGLIRTFNALLMIARAESGQARGNMDDFDAADVAKGIHELYEPLAEDDGMTLRVKTRARAASRQPRADQPGAGQPGRERDQIRQAVGRRAAAGPRRRGAHEGDPDRGAARGRPRAAQRHRSRAGHSRSRPQARAWSASCGWKRAGRSRVPASASAWRRRSRRCMAANSGSAIRIPA